MKDLLLIISIPVLLLIVYIKLFIKSIQTIIIAIGSKQQEIYQRQFNKLRLWRKYYYYLV